MLRIWGRSNSINVQKVLWCCEELDVPYHRVDVGGPFGGNREPEYLRLNPNGLVPTISDGGFVLWESNVIVRYLAAKHGMGTLCPEDLAGAGRRGQVDGLADGNSLGQLPAGVRRSYSHAAGKEGSGLYSNRHKQDSREPGHARRTFGYSRLRYGTGVYHGGHTAWGDGIPLVQPRDRTSSHA